MDLFKIVGIVESISTIVLMFIAVPLKYIGDDPSLVKIMGPIHGMLFFGYIFMLWLGQRDGRWTTDQMIKGALWAIVPAGPIYYERKLIPESTVDA